MVVDDYYKKGKAINQEMTLYNNAKEMAIELDLKVEDHRVLLQSNTRFPALKISFIHSTLADRDFDLIMTANASGDYTATFDNDLQGKWQIIVSPLDTSWKVKTELALPTSQWIKLY